MHRYVQVRKILIFFHILKHTTNSRKTNAFSGSAIRFTQNALTSRDGKIVLDSDMQ